MWFVDLASLQDGRLLPFALAHTLQVTLASHSDPLEQVVQKLQEGPSLLVLDNFEHLLQREPAHSKDEHAEGGESALLVRLLLERVPGLKCLVTSRQPLNLGGEQELSVPMLPIPVKKDAPERLLEYAGAALYIDRAKAVKPEFALTEHNAEAAEALCGRDALAMLLELQEHSLVLGRKQEESCVIGCWRVCGNMVTRNCRRVESWRSYGGHMQSSFWPLQRKQNPCC